MDVLCMMSSAPDVQSISYPPQVQPPTLVLRPDLEQNTLETVKMTADRQPGKYAYASLPNRTSSVRLLSVLTAAPNNLVCSLRVAPALSSEPYHRLSYTWGCPFGRTGTDARPSRKQMICNSAVLPIQENLYDELLRLQRHCHAAQQTRRHLGRCRLHQSRRRRRKGRPDQDEADVELWR